MLDGAARIGEVVGGRRGRRPAGDRHHRPRQHVRHPRLLQGVPEAGDQARSSAPRPTWRTTRRHERPARRGRVDDSGGDADGGKKLYYHLTLLAEDNTGYKNLIQLASRAFMEGYYYKPRVDWETAVRAQRGPHRHHRLPRRARAAVADAGRRRGRHRPRPAASRTSSARTTSSSSCRTTASPSSTGPTRSCSRSPRRIGAPLLATNDSHYVHREDAVAHDALLCVQTGLADERPRPLQVPRRRALPEVGGRDAPRCSARCPRRATTRCGSPSGPTSRSSSASRSCPTSRCPRGSPTTATTSRHLTFEGREGALGRAAARRRRRAARPTSSRSSRTWASARTSSSCGT